MDTKTTNRQSVTAIIAILAIFVLLPMLTLAGILASVALTSSIRGMAKKDMMQRQVQEYAQAMNHQASVTAGSMPPLVLSETTRLRTQMNQNNAELNKKMNMLLEKIDALTRELEEMKKQAEPQS